MKAVTVKQPWATLIALGLKRFETRSWRTKYRGPIAIHAAKQVDKQAYADFQNILREFGINDISELPTGAIVAVGEIKECHKVVKDHFEFSVAETDKGIKIREEEYSLGNYEEGRYAWELSDVMKLVDPIPAKGQLSLWDWQNDESMEIKMY